MAEKYPKMKSTNGHSLMYEKIIRHTGHKIVVARYGRDFYRTENVTVECEECNEVLVDADNPDWDEWR